MTEQRPTTGEHPHTEHGNRWAEHLRYIPPAAALGTAAVLQVILITDTVGTALANRFAATEQWPWYLFAALLGLAVASCAEGGAAYLMDLYDKHLLAGDSVWVLRASMLAYVGGSAAAIHWWTEQRHLPTVVGWLLAGMSASALFLWSRGSRWRRREALRAAGQLDPAMPRLSAATKFWHPIRWANTLRLVSWEPAATTAEARARYDTWKAARTGTPITRPAVAPRTAPMAEQPTPQPTPNTPTTVVPITTRPPRQPRRTITAPTTGPAPTVEQLADTLAEHPKSRGRVVGRPTAERVLRGVFGSCDSTRAKAAKDRHNERIQTAQDDPDRDRERALVAV